MAKQRPEETWDEFARRLGTRLQQRRIEHGFSQERLAHAAGITRYTYQKLEKGESSPGRPANPSLRNIMAVAQQLEVTLDELLPAPWPDLGGGR
ncbi:helix-turn-helix transcriptional regulator [Leucobacter sp. CSA1]|uniref:Helix-turn-helix transcriptional regulator n=1 Tax=Leucobacter chromiisoli TaxID=2796471 RepID=A0A934UUV4_9MICO|nr:helix-turn-helix transcriptional regulator [Leucobacter chromiisoli]MBK0419914.1 helix-turn-helix transcriptional regulator [Leucobacter chromiisoli]